MRKNPKVSIIVPVWNPGQGIRWCVESLRGQTLEDIEMIFVDDCSTDGAMDVVRAAAKEDLRIRIMENPQNLGSGISRNKGIEVARGEYLSFVDADDYVDSDFMEVLYHKGKAENLDIVKGGFVYEYKGGTTKSNSYTLNDDIQNGLKGGYPLFLLFSYEHPSAIFHRQLFVSPSIRYGLSRNAEDTTFLLKACHIAKSFGIDDHVAYHYIYRNDSTSNVITKASLESRIEGLRDEVEFLVTCIEPNPYAIQYFIKRIKKYLSLERYVFKKVGMEKEAMKFHADLQAIASNYPAIGVVKNNEMTILALVDYGEGLVEWPYSPPWEVPQPEDYADVVARRVNFLQSHPEYYKELPVLISKADGFAKQMKSDGISKEEIEAYEKQIRALWRKPLIMWMLFKNKLRRVLDKLKRKCFDKKLAKPICLEKLEKKTPLSLWQRFLSHIQRKKKDVDEGRRKSKVFITPLKNAGDAFNNDLLEFFRTEMEPVRIAAHADLLMLGGALSSLQNPDRTIDYTPLHVWGSGFLFGDDNDIPLCRPNLIVHALRGKLSKDKLSGLLNTSLPENIPLADPGLLASNFTTPNTEKKYAIGFIPHFREHDTDEVKRVLGANASMHFIDITQSPKEVIREIQQCETVVSSSLHGLVFSDSLGVPNVHVRLTELPKGGTFKFRDYYSAFGLSDPTLSVEDVFGITPDKIKTNYAIERRVVEEKKRQLIESFPFL